MDNPIIYLANSIQNKRPAVLATVVEIVGASPTKTGAQMVLFADGTTTGTVGGGKLEAVRHGCGEREDRISFRRLCTEWTSTG